MKAILFILMFLFIVLALRSSNDANDIELTIFYVGSAVWLLFAGLNIDKIKESNKL